MVWSRGTTFLGEGFVLSKEECAELLADAPESAAIVQNLMGGSDVLGRADGSPSRFVINFGDMGIESAKRYEAALQRLVVSVKPQRDRLTRQIHEHCFWKHWDKRRELYDALRALPRAVVFPMVSKHVVYSIAEEPAATIFSDQLGVIADERFGLLGIMQSNVNVVWVLANSNRRGGGVRMSIRACLGTFPFPENWRTDLALEFAGKTYYEFRAKLAVQDREGLTTIYNRYHDPDERDPAILKLRELHTAMDRVVLDAYGWTDVPSDCQLGAALLRREVFALFMGLFARGCVSPVLSSGGTATKPARTRVFPAASRASKRYRIPSVCPPRARSLLDIRAAFWYGSMGRGTDL